MKYIFSNPYRILGLPITASDREVCKRVDELHLYAEMGKEKAFPTDLPFLHGLKRGVEEVESSAGSLESPKHKAIYSLYWFLWHTPVDEMALELLRDGNVLKGLEILEKAVAGKVINSSNISTFRNLALLKIALCLNEQAFSKPELLNSARGLIDVVSSELFSELVEKTGGPTCTLSKEELLQHIAEELHYIVSDNTGAVNSNIAKLMMEAFSGAPEYTRTYVEDKIAAKAFQKSENLVEACAEVRQNSPEQTYEAAKRLNQNIANSLDFLAQILPPDNLRLIYICDKAAEELLICSTAHFNHLSEIDEDDRALKESRTISNWAQKIARGPNTKAKIKQDLDQIKQLEARQGIGDLVEGILNSIPEPDSITMAQLRSLKSKIPKLKSDVAKLAQLDPSARLPISTGIVMKSSACCISYMNKNPNCISAETSFDTIYQLYTSLGGFSMTSEVEGHYRKNLALIVMAKNRSQSSGFCYIATLVYESYDAPEVIKLRRFRDKTLKRFLLGRAFIKIYYALSPHVVEMMRGKRTIQSYVRKVLDLFVGKLD